MMINRKIHNNAMIKNEATKRTIIERDGEHLINPQSSIVQVVHSTVYSSTELSAIKREVPD